LSREAGIASHSTVEQYLAVLEKMFVLFRVPFFSIDQKQAVYRKNSKFYFTDPFILNCLKARTEGYHTRSFAYTSEYTLHEKHRPVLMENTAASHLNRAFAHLYYGRGGNDAEIDFAGLNEGEYSYYEVKYQGRVKPGEFSGAAMPAGVRRLTVLSRSDYYEGDVTIMPAEIFLAFFSGGDNAFSCP
jgi:predicted AAA+ superfamily ATPase